MADWILWIFAVVGAVMGSAAAASLKKRVPGWSIAGAIPLFLVAGVFAAMGAIIAGELRALPGLQLNPDLRHDWGQAITAGVLPDPDPQYGLLAILAHLLLWAPRPSAASFWRPLPATLLFVALVLLGQSREVDEQRIRHHRFLSEGTAAAWTTVKPLEEKNTAVLLISRGVLEDTFLDIAFREEMELPPLDLVIHWTRDEEVLLVGVRVRTKTGGSVHHDLMGIRADGTIVGGLPARAADWPRENMNLLSRDARRFLGDARRAVDLLKREHRR